ncbi:Pentatricopeptide repeat-containing protein At2g42920, chloroplastic [Ancistrocladus abbreviatus]
MQKKSQNMAASLSSLTPQISISKFIADHPHLTLLERNCNTMKDLKKLHAHLIKTGLSKDTIAISRVLAFCIKSPAGDINYAYSVFTRIKNQNIFSWNTIIRGFSQSSSPHNAIYLFIDMLVNSPIQPQRLTYPSVFKAYAQLGLAQEGSQLHGRVIKLGLEFDPFIRNTIIYMYANSGFLSDANKIFNEDKTFDVVAWNSMILGLAKSGKIDECRRLFDKMGSRTVVSWNTMISGYVRKGKLMDAFQLFEEMAEKRINPNEFTAVSLLNASAQLGALEQGEWIHRYICKNNFELNAVIVTAIVDMYCKCGAIEKARQVFEISPKRALSCWNSMILGLANNGYEDEAIQLFSELVLLNIEPDDVTFLGVLTACIYLGCVHKARDFFWSMTRTYKIEPSIKHYGCMVEVLGQAGLLTEVEEFITSMPIEPDAIIWGSLLSACRKHGNVEMAKRAAKHARELDMNDSSGYILMANVYAASGQFESSVRQRISMKQHRILKERGCSSIEVGGVVHEFASGGRMYPEVQELIQVL